MAFDNLLRRDIHNFVADYFGDENGRKPFLQVAGFDAQLLRLIDYDGNTHDFTAHLIERLWNYGREE